MNSNLKQIKIIINSYQNNSAKTNKNRVKLYLRNSNNNYKNNKSFQKKNNF